MNIYGRFLTHKFLTFRYLRTVSDTEMSSSLRQIQVFPLHDNLFSFDTWYILNHGKTSLY
jgi:hypothetical protein